MNSCPKPAPQPWVCHEPDRLRGGGPVTDVVYLLEELNFGGTQRQTLELAARLDRRRFAPVIWTFCGGKPDLLDWAGQHDITVLPLTPHPTFRPQAALPALWRQLKATRPELIHLCTALPNIWGRIMSALRGLPRIVASCRSGTAIGNQHERFLWRLAHVHICNTRPLRRTLIENIGLPAERVVHIPNGVDTEHFSPAPILPDSPDIVCVGRMVPDKDHATLLEAFARVLTVVPQARLHLVGQGRLEPSIRARAARSDCRDRVIFLPGDTDLRPILRKARVFVLASASEGLPNVLLEAMACALPVVGTRVGGIPELIEDNLNGLLAAPADPESLAVHLVRLLGDHEACTRLGRAGRERAVSDYSHITMVSQHENVYTKLMERRAR